MLPVLEASIPPAIKVNFVSDRTQTIRASVADVQNTLLLTVALVVMVIFIFLRNFWATVIPAVTVPLALIGTFGVLYELGYSLDNLFADGPVDRGRLCGRRRRRRDREHRAAYGGWPLTIRCGHEGVRRDRLHRHGPILIAAALFVIYLILGILYESVIHPVTILSTLPAAGLGALLLLMAAHFDLSVIAIVGVLLLIGIVKKNGIMLVDFAQQVEHSEGLTAEQSIYQACTLRFRPILMTTMAALLGAVPMMLGTGTGSEIRQPLGYAIVGGLAVSRGLLTLYTTPVIYIYFDQLQSWMMRRRKKRATSGEAEPQPTE